MMSGIIAGLPAFALDSTLDPKMEASDLKCRPPFRVVTFRDEQEVISEGVETEIAAQTRVASAIDLRKTRDDARSHLVELHASGGIVAAWPKSER